MSRGMRLMLSVAILLLALGTILVHLPYSSPHKISSTLQPTFIYDSTKSEFFSLKKQLMLKDYDSLFEVFGRETTIEFNLLGWSITLVALCLTFLFAREIPTERFKFIYWSILIIVFNFYILEVSERSVMLGLLDELRNLERIFNMHNTKDFYTAVLNYVPRDLQDEKIPLFNKYILVAAFDIRILWINVFLIGFSFTLVGASKHRAITSENG